MGTMAWEPPNGGYGTLGPVTPQKGLVHVLGNGVFWRFNHHFPILVAAQRGRQRATCRS